ncbi:helix-turn-helix domain-containing protein [Streptomyces sp. IBSBF 3010]|uniref:helix-turn-helix domain-containing protein n=1 Tax=Streptomyces sp. IBSBF 3010 TaxID=2903526 RepID=UPI002FDC4CCB
MRSLPAPQAPARKGPTVDADRAARCTEAVRDIAEDLVLVADALLHRASDDAAATVKLFALVCTVADLAQEATGALVVRQRSQGEPLDELALMADRSIDRLRKKYPPRTIDQNLAKRHRPMRAPSPARPAEGLPTPANSLRKPTQRLACALTRMWKQAGVSQRTVAQHMNVDPSYVSRMLSGQREITLQNVKLIVDACDGNLELIKPLWDAANGIQPTAKPARALRAYLCALRYAAGSPSDKQILASLQRSITKDELRKAFDGPGVPEWPVVQQLTLALQSLPDITRPLWRKAHTDTDTDTRTLTLPAAAFG